MKEKFCLRPLSRTICMHDLILGFAGVLADEYVLKEGFIFE